MQDIMTSTAHSNGAFRRDEVTAGATEQYVVIASTAPTLLASYRVRNTGDTNACDVRVLRSLTSMRKPTGPSDPEWTEVVASASVAEEAEVSGDLETLACAFAIEIKSTSGTTAVVELAVAK